MRATEDIQTSFTEVLRDFFSGNGFEPLPVEGLQY
jgi:hypothetical protein